MQPVNSSVEFYDVTRMFAAALLRRGGVAAMSMWNCRLKVSFALKLQCSLKQLVVVVHTTGYSVS